MSKKFQKPMILTFEATSQNCTFSNFKALCIEYIVCIYFTPSRVEYNNTAGEVEKVHRVVGRYIKKEHHEKKHRSFNTLIINVSTRVNMYRNKLCQCSMSWQKKFKRSLADQKMEKKPEAFS